MVIDLSHQLHPEMPVYPGTAKPKFIPQSDISTDGFIEHRLEFSSHTGTHIDVPVHMIVDGLSLENIPVERFVGPGWLCDISDYTDRPVGEDVIDLPAGTEFLLFYSGWDQKWGSTAYFEGYPFLSRQAVDWLLDKKLKGIGFDMISADHAKNANFPVHTALLSHNILLIENLTNLNSLLGRKFIFLCLPLNWENGDGSPVRAIAILDP